MATLRPEDPFLSLYGRKATGSANSILISGGSKRINASTTAARDWKGRIYGLGAYTYGEMQADPHSHVSLLQPIRGSLSSMEIYTIHG